MAHKTYLLNNEQEVRVFKRKNSKHIKLSIGNNGGVKVSIPSWAPYSSGLTFAKNKYEWIVKNKKPLSMIYNNQQIGKAHHLIFENDSKLLKPKGNIKGSNIIIKYGLNSYPHDSATQTAARNISIKALKLQAESLLPQRLSSLASSHNLTYSSVKIKKLKSRWGSCDQDKNIVLNLYLMELPWDLIDYVLLHELTHTLILKHGPEFWSRLQLLSSNAKDLKRNLHSIRPTINST